jgi:integrase
MDEEASRHLISAFYRVRLLTAQRGREVPRMKRLDVSQEPSGAVWAISTEITKNRRSHRVPLCQAVMDILDAARTRAEGERQPANKARATKGETPQPPVSGSLHRRAAAHR